MKFVGFSWHMSYSTLAISLELFDSLGNCNLGFSDVRSGTSGLDDVQLLILRRHLNVDIVGIHQLLDITTLVLLRGIPDA